MTSGTLVRGWAAPLILLFSIHAARLPGSAQNARSYDQNRTVTVEGEIGALLPTQPLFASMSVRTNALTDNVWQVEWWSSSQLGREGLAIAGAIVRIKDRVVITGHPLS